MSDRCPHRRPVRACRWCAPPPARPTRDPALTVNLRDATPPRRAPTARPKQIEVGWTDGARYRNRDEGSE